MRFLILFSLLIAPSAFADTSCRGNFKTSRALDAALKDVNERVQKYISKSRAASAMMSFPVTPNGRKKGSEKLVVAVSESSWSHFVEHVLSNPRTMTVVGHANVIHKGKFYGYNGGGAQEIRPGNLGTPYPLLTMTTTEARRMTRYMDTAMLPNFTGWYNALKQPWMLPGYAIAGGYSCCTHWIGNIPIGDKLVEEYSFPGREGEEPRTQRLAPYQVPAGQEILEEIWTVPGHEQLADVIGQKKANLAGEFASPGYVIHTLIGPTDAARVPVIFVMVEDHTKSIPSDIKFEFENPH